MLFRSRNKSIPKEAPWKTLVLNKQFREKRGCEFSTVTSGTERKRGFVGIDLFLCGNFCSEYDLLIVFLFSSRIWGKKGNESK